MERTYFKTVTSKLTFNELWRIAGCLTPFFYAATHKLFGTTLSSPSGFANPSQVHRLTWPELPGFARRLLGPISRECMALGIHRGFFYELPSVGCTRCFAMAMRSEDGAFALTAMCASSSNGNFVNESATYSLYTLLSNDQVIVTGAGRQGRNGPPECDADYLAKNKMSDAIARHKGRLATAMSGRPIPINDLSSLAGLINRIENLSFQLCTQRGLYVPMSPEEVREAQAYESSIDMAEPVLVQPSVATAIPKVAEPTSAQQPEPTTSAITEEVPAEPSGQHAPVLTDIELLREKKPSWITAVSVFAISLLLFLLIGAVQWSWWLMFLLIPILFFHEMGHYVAMRAFQYRNLQMFFIPLFGAAVTGQNYDVPGWKKIVVSLAGPLPGIVLGTLLGIVGWALDLHMLLVIGALTLLVNTVNLLPVVPLDGGWVMHSMLFSRHHLLDLWFRIVAVFVLVGGGLLMGTWILPALGVFMAVGLPTVYRMACITDRLRDRDLNTASTNGETVPTATAQVILDEIEREFPIVLSNRMKARATLHIFESLNARPPAVGPSWGFAAVHGFSFAIAVSVCGFLFIELDKKGDTGVSIETVSSVNPSEIVDSTQLNPESRKSAEEITCIATFASQQRAKDWFFSRHIEVDDAAKLTLFGSSVLFSYQADRATQHESLLSQLRSDSLRVVEHRDHVHMVFELKCFAPSLEVANDLQDEADQYMEISRYEYLVPPWHPQVKVLPSQLKARRTYRLIYEKAEAYSDPVVVDLAKQMQDASILGDGDAVKRLTQEQLQRMANLEQQHYQQLRDLGPERVDFEMIDEYFARIEGGAGDHDQFEEQRHQRMLQRLGRLRIVDGTALPGEERYSITFGRLQCSGFKLHFEMLIFERPIDGAPALAKWLQSKGCTNFEYNFSTEHDQTVASD